MGCSTTGGYSGHAYGTDSADQLPWGAVVSDIHEQISSMEVALSSYPFLLTYKYRWIENLAGLELDHAGEVGRFWFDDNGGLYGFDITYSTTPLDKGVYTTGVINRSEQLMEKFLERFGEPDHFSSTDVGQSDLIVAMMAAQGQNLQPGDMVNIDTVWNSVPLGNPIEETRVELSFSKFYNTVRFTESYGCVNLIPENGNLYRDLYTLETRDFLANTYEELTDTIKCKVSYLEDGNWYFRNFTSITPISFIVMHPYMDGQAEKVRFLLEQGADPNQGLVIETSDGTIIRSTALHYALFFKMTEISRLLIEAGADTETKDESFNRTPRELAEIQGLDEILALLDP
jgi:hypothetical protein